MSKEDFKNFVRSYPNLVKHVNNGSMTWQKFYDMYLLYGEDVRVWKQYTDSVSISENLKPVTGDTTMKEVINMVKTVDLDKVRRGVDGLQKAIGLLQEIGSGSKREYEPRPIYKHLDD